MTNYKITLGEIKKVLGEFELLEHCSGGDSLELCGISYNSQDIAPGSLFFCKGVQFRPEYLTQALSAGAVCYIAEKEYAKSGCENFCVVKDVRKAMSVASAAFYGNPAEKLKTTGVTGTKGKTTTSYFIRNILESSGRRTAFFSSVENYTGSETTEAHLTTPESLDLQGYIAKACENGLEHLTMEVSSQAYKHSRVYGMRFDTGIFLNIGMDHIGHLEHNDFDDYFGCKLQFLAHCKNAVINTESDHFDIVYDTARAACQNVITFGLRPEADYYISAIKKLKKGLEFAVFSEKYAYNQTLTITMDGRFNAENAVAALIAARLAGVADSDIQAGLTKTLVPGRMNVFEKNGITVIVDYAHNEVSFDKLYQSVKSDYPGAPIKALFGSAGGRSQIRRAQLARSSGKYADYVILTAEDPQREPVENICNEIAESLKPYNTPFEIIPDRKTAVEKIIGEAKTGDVIILAGKGEETYQKVDGEYAFYESDVALAQLYLNEK